MPMTVGADIASDLDTIAADARRLEALGVDAVFVGETQHNPFLPLTLVAEHTRRLTLGTSVAIAFPRVPHVTANIAWDLSRYSGGRFVLGLGTQVKAHTERRFSVPWAPPGPRLRDYIACMRAIWDSWQHGTKPAYEGEFYRYRLTGPFFNPGPIAHPDIPVMISAANPFNARLAGEVCDGITIHPFATFRYIREALVPALHEGARAAGRDVTGLRVRGGGFVVTGRDAREVDEAREATRRQIAFYASTRSYAHVMKHHGWDDEAARLRQLATDAQWDEMPRVITDAMLDEFCVTGTWDELPSAMRARLSGVTTQLTLPLDAARPEDDGQLAEIIAALQTIPALGEM